MPFFCGDVRCHEQSICGIHSELLPRGKAINACSIPCPTRRLGYFGRAYPIGLSFRAEARCPRMVDFANSLGVTASGGKARKACIFP